MFILKAIKSHCKRSYDKQNLTLMVISYELYEMRRRLVSKMTKLNDHCCVMKIQNVVSFMKFH